MCYYKKTGEAIIWTGEAIIRTGELLYELEGPSPPPPPGLVPLLPLHATYNQRLTFLLRGLSFGFCCCRRKQSYTRKGIYY